MTWTTESFWEGLRPKREVEPEPEDPVLPEDLHSMDIGDMVGYTMVSVTGNVGEDSLMFTARNGVQFEFYHEPDCCESVRIEDIVGDLNDLVGYPLVEAEELSSEPDPPLDHEPDSFTWTFYRFSTVRGTVTVRWLGESNGYYSERVDFRVLPV